MSLALQQLELFSLSVKVDDVLWLIGPERDRAIQTIIDQHYTHSVSSGKTYYFRYQEAIIAYSIPANNNIANYLLGFDGNVWELSRLWAPDGHAPNLLTQAISKSLRAFKSLEPDIDAVVSYADPNVGHTGGVYRAASWIYTGQCEDGRYYIGSNGDIKARRSFHSGRNIMVKAEIEASGYQELNLPGKHRYVKPISRQSRKVLRKWRAVPA